MSIKILIPAKIKLRGEEIGGAFRSIIYDKLKKFHDKKDNNFGYVKSIDPNIEIDEGVFDVTAYAEVIKPLLGEVIITTITEINIINNSCAVEAKYYGMTVHIWNFDKDINRTQCKVAIYSRSSIQNTYYRWFWIRKNKCIITFNKQSARH